MRILIFLICLGISFQLFASKSRVQALSNMHWVTDTRDVFVNPSSINELNNYVITEWEDSTGTNTNAKPEGGFMIQSGVFVYGLYLGNKEAVQGIDALPSTTVAGRSFSNSSTKFLAPENQLDLMIGGDAGILWGFRVQYAEHQDTSNQSFTRENRSVGLGLGLSTGALEIYTNLLLKDESKGSTDASYKWKADLGIEVGTEYTFGDYKIVAEYDQKGFNQEEATQLEFSDKSWYIGMGKMIATTRKARIMTEIQVKSRDAEEINAGATKKDSWFLVPIRFGFEVDAKEWLSFRGSIIQHVLSTHKKNGYANNGKSSYVESDVVAGVSLKFEKLNIDGLVGTDNTASGTSVLETNDFMTKVAAHYWF